MKPVIKVWHLPEKNEDQLRQLHAEIVAAVVAITALRQNGVKNEDDVAVLFPKDMMSYGLGFEIIVEGTRFPAISATMRELVAEKLGEAIYKMFPDSCVESSISGFNNVYGLWSSHQLPC